MPDIGITCLIKNLKFSGRNNEYKGALILVCVRRFVRGSKISVQYTVRRILVSNEKNHQSIGKLMKRGKMVTGSSD